MPGGIGSSLTPFRGGVGCRSTAAPIVGGGGGDRGSGGCTGFHDSSLFTAGAPSTTLEGTAAFVSGDAVEDAATWRMERFLPFGSFLSSDASDDDEKLRSVGDNDWLCRLRLL